MGHFLTKLRRHHHHHHQNQNQNQNQTQTQSQTHFQNHSSSPSTPTTSFDINNNSSTLNTSFNGIASSTQNISFPSSSSTTTNANSYIFAANAAHSSPNSSPLVPAPVFSNSPDYYRPPPPSSLMACISPLFSVSPPPPYVDHKSAKKIKNDVNIHKDSIRLFLDDNNLDSHLVSFTFDALVDGCITIFYFAKEGPNCTFMPLYPGMYMPKRIPFQKGLAQKFYQPSGTGIDLGFFALALLSRPSKKEDIFPLVISAEASLPSFSADAGLDQPQPTMSPHAQITQAVLNQNYEGHFEVQVIKQILWIEGIRYELREIYGIDNASDQGFDGNTDQSGKACVICMTEPKDTAVLPCRHLCMCSECAKQLRFRSKKCPVCRQSIQELLEIKINNQTMPAV